MASTSGSAGSFDLSNTNTNINRYDMKGDDILPETELKSEPE